MIKWVPLNSIKKNGFKRAGPKKDLSLSHAIYSVLERWRLGWWRQSFASSAVREAARTTVIL